METETKDYTQKKDNVTSNTSRQGGQISYIGQTQLASAWTAEQAGAMHYSLDKTVTQSLQALSLGDWAKTVTIQGYN